MKVYICNILIYQCIVFRFFFSPYNTYCQEYFITDSYFIKDICSIDIDLDNDNDLIICSSSNFLPDTLFIYYNNGMGSLCKTSMDRRNGIFIHCGRIDNDEYPDIITKDSASILFIKTMVMGRLVKKL